MRSKFKLGDPAKLNFALYEGSKYIGNLKPYKLLVGVHIHEKTHSIIMVLETKVL